MAYQRHTASALAVINDKGDATVVEIVEMVSPPPVPFADNTVEREFFNADEEQMVERLTTPFNPTRSIRALRCRWSQWAALLVSLAAVVAGYCSHSWQRLRPALTQGVRRMRPMLRKGWGRLRPALLQVRRGRF